MGIDWRIGRRIELTGELVGNGGRIGACWVVGGY